jgi:hypothetical protein
MSVKDWAIADLHLRRAACRTVTAVARSSTRKRRRLAARRMRARVEVAVVGDVVGDPRLAVVKVDLELASKVSGVKRACIVSSLLEVSGRLLTSTCAELPAELSPQSLALRRTAADSCTSPTTTSKPAAACVRDVSQRLGFWVCPAAHSTSPSLRRESSVRASSLASSRCLGDC